MKVTFYKYCNGRVQQDKIDKVESIKKSDLMKIADLGHPVLTRKEYFQLLLTDAKGKPKNEFYLMTNTHYLICKNKVNK